VKPAEDICGNPTMYNPDGVMGLQERTQVREVSQHCAQMHVFKRALHLKKMKYRRKVRNLIVGEKNARKQVKWKGKKLKEAEFKAAHLEPLKRQAFKYLTEITALKTENQRLRDKHMQELEGNCSQITEDPVPRLKLEIEKLDQNYHKMLQEIEWRDNVISALKTVK
jgi:hypothetical protein